MSAAIDSFLHKRAVAGMEAAIVVNALRGERRVGPVQQAVLNQTRRNFELMAIEAANSCMRVVAAQENAHVANGPQR